MKSIQILYLSFFLLLNNFAFAQNEFIIKGTVTDANSNETLPFANVFVANTTFGTSTDASGNYELKLPSSGSYDLIISFMGYETFARSVRFVKPNVVMLDVNMITKSKRIQGVTVTARKDELWKSHLERFKGGFLGKSKAARRSNIVNEEVLNFEMDRETGVFEAYASEPLVIENKELGYRLIYLLEDYRVFIKDGFSTFYGFSAFEELQDGPTRNKFIKQRDKAYFGSLQHFFHELYNENLTKAGYEIYLAFDIEGTGRMIDPNPVELNKILSTDVKSQVKRLEFKDFLYVYFKPERESSDYLTHQFGSLRIEKSEDKDLKRSQNSWIKMRDEGTFIEFESNGYITNPMDFYSYGYWGYEKIGDMMPMNYIPSTLIGK
jgi:CarboxypepD_reg-like domain